MKVLSLCDGMSCGRIALEKAGIKVDKYYASEIKDIAIHTQGFTKINFNVSFHEKFSILFCFDIFVWFNWLDICEDFWSHEIFWDNNVFICDDMTTA